SAARAAPGVIAVYTAADLTAAGVRDVPGAGLPANAIGGAKPALQQPPLARGRVRYVGEPVVAIQANALAEAKDAADLIELEIGGASRARPQPPLARGRVRYGGGPVVAIQANSLAEAKDAADLIELEIGELPAAVTPADAVRDGAPAIHEQAQGNVYGHLTYG